MKVTKLDENETSLKKVVSDIKTMHEHSSEFFFDRFDGDVDEKQVKAFNHIKSWQPIYALEDSCFYASELAYVLTNNTEYAVISHYNAGGSVLDHTKILMAANKQQLKDELNKLFAFNGLDSITDKRIAPRFDFDALVDSFPDIQVNDVQPSQDAPKPKKRKIT